MTRRLAHWSVFCRGLRHAQSALPTAIPEDLVEEILGKVEPILIRAARTLKQEGIPILVQWEKYATELSITV
jgi:hypothetical protein